MTETLSRDATDLQTSSPRILSEAEKEIFELHLSEAEQAAAAYDGTLQGRIGFMRAAKKLHDFAGAGTVETPVTDLITLYAAQTRPDAEPFTIDGLYRQARRTLRGDADQPSAYDKIFAAMEEAGATVDRKGKKPLSSIYPSAPDAEYAPKLGAIIDTLADRALLLDDMSIITGPEDSGDLRDQYVVLSVPKLGVQIAICDRIDKPAYISLKERPDTFWVPLDPTYHEDNFKRLTKIEATSPNAFIAKTLLAMGIAPRTEATILERFYWGKDIPETLGQASDAVAEQVPVRSPKVIRLPDTPAAIEMRTERALPAAPAPSPLVRTETVPVVKKDFVAAVTSGSNNDPAQDLEEALAYFKEHKKFIFKTSSGNTGAKVMHPWIIERVAEYRNDNEGRAPVRNSGELKGHPDLTWEMVDDAIYAHGRHHKIHLNVFIEKNCPIANNRKPRAKRTPLQGNFAEAAGSAPAETLPNLPPALTPDQEYSLRHLKEQGTFIRQTLSGAFATVVLKPWILAQMESHRQENNGREATRASGPIKNYPDLTWAMLEDAIQKRFHKNLASYAKANEPQAQRENAVVQRTANPA